MRIHGTLTSDKSASCYLTVVSTTAADEAFGGVLQVLVQKNEAERMWPDHPLKQLVSLNHW
jgi:hypothetical protein